MDNKMYLAINDEVIATKQKEVEELNDKLIVGYHSLPFVKKLVNKDDIRQQITANWQEFETWMNQRIREQSNERKSKVL